MRNIDFENLVESRLIIMTDADRVSPTQSDKRSTAVKRLSVEKLQSFKNYRLHGEVVNVISFHDRHFAVEEITCKKCVI